MKRIKGEKRDKRLEHAQNAVEIARLAFANKGANRHARALLRIVEQAVRTYRRRLREPLGLRMAAKKPGTCVVCRAPISTGDPIRWAPRVGAACASCSGEP